MYAEYQRMAEDVRSAKRRLTEIRATAESEDGLISATVGGSGELVELWLDPRIYRTPDSTALAEAIAGTLREAAQRAQEEGFAILADFLPSDATPETADLRFDPLLTDLDREIAGGGRR
ncbi:YbaB/EbfC family nucleoid-associated protein [Solihabitans fulvus]|uniref:YbaB/EbfC family nucleoid-associated protein n=2 Tax=Solihabitans fulvus TaxID=1892852 RepID=A0A5B2XUM6_9PSEU|nr:YbaB/EbfC family nucleoid-associated protein [Solihabitans fulvus]